MIEAQTIKEAITKARDEIWNKIAVHLYEYRGESEKIVSLINEWEKVTAAAKALEMAESAIGELLMAYKQEKADLYKDRPP